MATPGRGAERAATRPDSAAQNTPPGRLPAIGPLRVVGRGSKDLPMSNLVLELRQGELMIINGAPIRFRTRSRIELTAHARFLFGKQIMLPTEADTPARRIYFALQSAYIGDDTERPRGLEAARELIADFRAVTTSALARDILDRALAAAEADDGYQALKLARRIMRHEAAVLGPAAPPRSPEPIEETAIPCPA